MSLPMPPVNVAHIADEKGEKCARCGALLGSYIHVIDDEQSPQFGQTISEPWPHGQPVIEYEQTNGRSAFADSVMQGRTVECQP